MGRIKTFFKRPFQNLTALERLVQWIRIISTFANIVLSLMITDSAWRFPTKFYMGRLDTFQFDIAQGIFNVLKDTMETSNGINNGVGLTTSELYILTSYTLTQVENFPQYITASLYGTCNTWFNTTEMPLDGTMLVEAHKRNSNSSITNACYYNGSDFIFDYREILSTYGLKIVLDYAYPAEKDATGYNGYLKWTRTNKIHLLKLMKSVITMEFITFFLTYWYYSVKGRFINGLQEKILVHLISLLSFTVFICGIVSIAGLAFMNYTLQSRIKTELGGFGFSYHLGRSWFCCLWLLTSFLGIGCLIWSGLEWCISDTEEPNFDDPDNQMLGYQPGVFTGTDNNDNKDTAILNETNEPGSDMYLNRHGDANSSRSLPVNPFDDQSRSASIEEYEMETISLRHSNESERSIQKIVQPSPTMYF
ncbi:Ecm7p NDAI_0J02750 [Naumovozyma dairenensis CBS 421]|uniref:Protein ECM7 n=1 Tax=Naumovozyma dairenensis (strain ATCC 10597 / BCRC 20456 / CBS 421 / NBRC 0211 / NRRL Y-12639) TaxID=1071378 RepID=G0WH89_NAUDC|nr:hypothetical protein NDAI_0J02750 [Naumovozyma dairenensis CBS 421]CCD27167.1 hypothetical protein NDAI_0J02750 [Naumovozyma dairenensis CBS 421]